jgi:hypothetical protein
MTSASDLVFLEDERWVKSTSDLDARAVLARRQFSQSRFPLTAPQLDTLDRTLLETRFFSTKSLMN